MINGGEDTIDGGQTGMHTGHDWCYAVRTRLVLCSEDNILVICSEDNFLVICSETTISMICMQHTIGAM